MAPRIQHSNTNSDSNHDALYFEWIYNEGPLGDFVSLHVSNLHPITPYCFLLLKLSFCSRSTHNI